MSRDKKKNDDETPADWVARQSRVPRGLVTVRQQLSDQPDDQKIRKRSEPNRETPQPRRHHQSARNWQPKQHLVDRIDNSWRSEKVPYHDEHDPIARCCDPDDDHSCPNVSSRMARSKKWRRLSFVLLMVLTTFGYLWFNHIMPELEQDYGLKAGFLRQPRGTFGMAKGGDYEYTKEKIVRLDDTLLPGAENDPDGKRRLVFVGDIHGCKDELLRLLRQIEFDEEHDHLVATGDIISKGPDSAGVIDELIRLKASSVRGNHEDRILTLAAVKVEKFGQPEQLSKVAKNDAKLLEQLKTRHLDYLRELPLILRIPRLPLTTSLSKAQRKDVLASEILVVHAGLVPAVPLAKQDPYFVMNMRSLTKMTHVPSIEPADKRGRSVPWIESWNWYQNRLSKGRGIKGWHHPEPALDVSFEEPSWTELLLTYMGRGHPVSHKPNPRVVVYGHDSRVGFVNKRWSKGLDSACVRGGELTALVLDAAGYETYHSVACKNYEE